MYVLILKGHRKQLIRESETGKKRGMYIEEKKAA